MTRSPFLVTEKRAAFGKLQHTAAAVARCPVAGGGLNATLQATRHLARDLHIEFRDIG